ncbi:hypothetical protein KC19_10G163500 [Ceratodon purpureus]|uniref:Exonuclease domain-containing protein n=1 Tax=Ceratodon purpureus TaxID=3225 RepID=A0A8T0GPM0_CERPU|nr:hypothetical protein KC19_10G163500 [Ceratodon purpureus]
MSDGAAMAVVEVDSDSDGYVSASELNRRMLEKKKLFSRPVVEVAKGAYFDVYGAEAKAEVILHPPEKNSRLGARDLQGLVRWVLADGENPKWVFVRNKPLVKKVVMLLMPGLDAALYMEHPGFFKNLTRCCGAPRAIVGAGRMATASQTIESFFSCPQPRIKNGESRGLKRARSESEDGEDEQQGEAVRVSVEDGDDGNKRRRVESEQPNGDDVASSKNEVCLPASFYTLNARQLHLNGYSSVAEGEDILPGFVRTLPAVPGVTFLEMVAVDCEMCYTHVGLELTRVSMVNLQGAVLLDKLVKPENPITNYNTQYSGITKAMMADVTTTLADVQEDILKLVHAETILVGHSVENDLNALKILHPLVIDTALLYHHPRKGHMYKPALRVLTAMYLNRKIQGDIAGHDSVEDARAAMDLALLKIRKGPGFGKSMKHDCENLIEILARHGRHSSLIDRRPVLHQYAVGSCNAIIATSDEDVCAKAVKEVKKAGVDFLWAQFKDLDAYYEDRGRATEDWSTRMAEMAATMTCSVPAKLEGTSEDSNTKHEAKAAHRSLPEDLQRVLAGLDERFKKLYDALEPNTLLIVATGRGDTISVRRLQELKWKSRQGNAAGLEKWTRINEDVLEELAARAETTLAFTCMK